MSLSKKTRMPRSARHASIGGNRISTLPDELLHHVMSYLKARDAVRTCVLSRCWRNVWATARCLNIDSEGFTGVEEFMKFLYGLFAHHGCTPLDMFWLRAVFPYSHSKCFTNYFQIYMLIYYALRCNTRVLGLVHDGAMFTLGSGFTSLHLKKLHLGNFDIDNCFVQMLSSGCPALEELELVDCYVSATMFFSTTLKRLAITTPNLEMSGVIKNLEIDMTNLVSLHINVPPVRIPYLVDVSSLVTASIFIDEFSIGDEFSNEDLNVDCNILSALSNAISLESLCLTVPDEDFDLVTVLASDVLRCGSFVNLTNLSLGEWCLNNSFSPLLHLLRCSPKIEKLILNLTYEGEYDYDEHKQHAAVETELACNRTETQICKNLKLVEINCPQGDKRVHTIVRILLAKIAATAEIHIKTSEHAWRESY